MARPGADAAVDSSVSCTATDTAGSFDGYYQPEFPYVIGTCFYSEPIESNWSNDINQEELDGAIIDKNKFAKNTDSNLYLVTQFFFEASSFIKWEEYLNNLGNQLEIHAGLPGPANLKTLIGFAHSCGIGNSIKFLSKQALNISKIASTNTPDRIINDLANYKKSNISSKLGRIHFYPFGGMKRTSSWVNALINNDISINIDGEIRINDFKF